MPQLSARARDDSDATLHSSRSPAAASAAAMHRGSMIQLREARSNALSSPAATASTAVSPIAGQPASPASSAVSSSPSSRALPRLPSKAAVGLSSVRESTLLLIWRFVVNLKRRVASLVKSMHAKSAHIRSLLLTRFPQLARVPPMLLGQLCLKSQKKLFQRKYTLVQQGQISEWIYLVQMGSLAVYQQSEHVIAASGGAGVGVGSDSSSASASASAAASGKRFEALHLADIHAGDEVGIYGLLRPPTIVLGAAAARAGRRRKKQKGAAAAAKTKQSAAGGAKGASKSKPSATGTTAADSSSDSDDDAAAASRKRGHHRNGSSVGGGDDWRGGYPQPHTVIASQPSIVYALSARLFREVLLSVFGLYEEVRTELTNKYLLRLRRFELWEIGRMRMQKIKQIQQTLVEAATKGKAGTVGGRASGAQVDAAAVRCSFEQAEAIVARDSIADLFHGQKKMFQTMSALSGARDVHALHSGGESSDDGGEDVDEEEIGRGGFLLSGALPTDEGEVLLSQWNEKQTGALDKAQGSLSLAAPHHPPPNYKHVGILAQIHADKVGPPIPFVDTRRLVGSRRVYDLHANAGGAPTRHLITPSAKPSVSALALKAQGTEAQQQLAVRAIQHAQGHSLPPLTDATSFALLAHSQSHPALGMSLAAVDAASSSSSTAAAVASVDLDASGGYVAADGSYISAEELSYQRRLAKLQAKADRKAALKRTAEEEKFLEDILLVSQQVQEINVTTHKIQRIEANKAAAEWARERNGLAQPQQPASPSSARISALGQRKFGPSTLTVATGASQQLASPTAAASSRSPLHVASSPSLQLVVPASSSASIATPTPVTNSSSYRVLGLGKSASAAGLTVVTSSSAAANKQRNSFVSQLPDDFEPMHSPAGARGPPAHERRTSSVSGAGMLPGSPSLAAMSPSGSGGGGFGGITLPAENPLYEHLPTLPSPQLRGLFALLKEHGGGGVTGPGGNAALYLMDTLAATKQLAALPTLPSDHDASGGGSDDPSSPAHAKQKAPRNDHLHKRGSVLLDVGSPLQKLRRASIQHAANSATNSANASPQLGAASPLLASLSPTHSGSLLAPSRHQRHTSMEGQGGGISDPSISLPAGYHSASFHSFTDEAWKGVTRCTTPPLLPPALEDPRVALIRQGIERAQFRVKARGRETSVGIKEFSRDLQHAQKKNAHILVTPVNALEAQRKDRAAIEDAESKAQQHAASPTNSSHNSGSSTVIGPLIQSRDNPLADLQNNRVSVLHLFSMHKAKDSDYRALSEARAQAKLKAEQKAARKAAAQAAALKKAARAERRLARLVDPGLDAPDLLAPPGHASSSSSEDEDEDHDEEDDEVAGTLTQHSKRHVAKSEESKQQQFSPSQLLPQMSLGAKEQESLSRRHDTFLSPHHKRAIHGSHPLPLHSDTSRLGSPASQPLLSAEEQEFERARARRDHLARLELLQRQKLKPAPGVDADTLRARLKEQQRAEAECKQQQQQQQQLQPQPHRSSSPSTVRSPLRRPLGKSSSLPAFHAASSGGDASASALIAVHPSSLSSMLAASRTTRDQLVSALPSAANAFDLADGSEGGKLQPDHRDQRVIEALTMPAHKLCLSAHFTSNAKGTTTSTAAAPASATASSAPPAASSSSSSSSSVGDSIATSLASMLSPFRVGSDWTAGRGIVIPNYDEGPGGADLLAAIQRAAVDRSRKRIQADATQADQLAATTTFTQNREQPAAGRKDPRSGHRRSESSTPDALALQGALPPARRGAHNVYTPPGVYLSDRGGPPLAMLTRLKTPQGRAETPPQTRTHVQLKTLPLHLVQ